MRRSAPHGYEVAAGFEAAFEAFYAQLSIFRQSGSPRPAFGLRIRIGVVRPYVIIYRYDPDDDTIEILRVVHGRRRMTPELLPR